MSDRQIYVYEGGKQVRKQSKLEDWDFNAVRIGTDSLPISETGGDIDLNGAALRIGPATLPEHAATKDQLDDAQGYLQGQIDISNALILAVQARAYDNSSAIVSIFDALSAIFGGAPTEESFVATNPSQAIFDAISIEWSEDSALLDISVYINGKKQRQSTTGGLDRDFRKNSSQQLEFSVPVPENGLVTIKNYSPILIRPYFRNYVASVIGRTISAAQVFTIGTDRLGVYRNGIYLMRSATLGFPVDRYIEQAAISVELGESAIVDDVYALVHRGLSPTFKQFQSGIAGATVTIPTYVMGTGRLSVYRNGMLLNDSGLGGTDEQYTEASTTTIQLGLAATVDDYFVFEFAGEEPTWREDITSVTGVSLAFSNPLVMGDKKLLLFKNGRIMYDSLILANADERYQEASTTAVTLEVAAVATDIFTAIYQ